MKQVKFLLVAAALFCAAAKQQSSAIDIPPAPYFRDLRIEVTNQLTIASNAVAADKKLIAKLKSTLKTIDKNSSITLAPGTKTLALVAKALNKTSLSNVFDAQLQFIVDIYTDNYAGLETGLETQLNTAFPGKKRDAAQKALNKLIAAIDSASSNLNTDLASKALSLASKNLVVAQKAVTSAKNAPLPPSSFQATVAISGSSTTTFKPRLATVTPAVIGSGNFFVNAAGTSGSGINTKAISLSFALTDLVQGANTATITAGGANQYTTGGLNGNVSFNSTGGVSHVFWDAATKTLAGDFSFNGSEQDGARTATFSGTFSVHYQ